MGRLQVNVTDDAEGVTEVITGARNEVVGPEVVTVQSSTGEEWPMSERRLTWYLVPEARPAKVYERYHLCMVISEVEAPEPSRAVAVTSNTPTRATPYGGTFQRMVIDELV